jgi:hypothetical protein
LRFGAHRAASCERHTQQRVEASVRLPHATLRLRCAEAARCG